MFANSREKKGKKYSYSHADLEKIKERAYYIWEKKGRPSNSTVQDWLEAEQELRDEKVI